jgi:hypothetical protein
VTDRCGGKPRGQTAYGSFSVASNAEFDPIPLLERLVDAEIDFVVIGSVAGGAHGSSYPTSDLDVACARDRPNVEKLAALLRDLGATLRGAPPGTAVSA